MMDECHFHAVSAQAGALLAKWAAMLLLTLATVGLPASAASPQLATATARTVVAPHAYVSLEAVPRGRTFDLAVVAAIKRGYHINAHQVRSRYLIATEMETHFPAGFRAREISYPPGRLLKFSFSPEPLSVYTDSVTFRVRVDVLDDAPLGLWKLPIELRYQACNDRICLPPVKLPVVAEVRVTPVGTAARRTHSEIFKSREPLR